PLDHFAFGRRGIRLIEHGVRERPQEEASASGQDRHPPPGAYRVDPGPRVTGESACTVALVRIDEVETVVRDPGALGAQGFGGSDVHPAVHLSGVHRDDLAVDPPGYLHGDGGLAARGRTEDRERVVLSHGGRIAAPAPAARDARSWGARARRGRADRSRTADRRAAPSHAW